ncbi:MAG TPA: site-2 protease family protein [Gemmatimonadaceae bacterium]|nr:site-2 protease family protein [Gemmatimonadaceae bacterium]
MQTVIPPLELPADWRADPPRSRTQTWKWWGNVLLTIVMFVLIAAATMRITAMLMNKPVRFHPERLLSAIPMLIALVLAAALMLTLHELGHVAGGLLAGWRLGSLFVGPLRLLRESDGLHVYWHRIFLMYGGAAIVVPRRWEPPAAQRGARILYVAGGPATSILIGIGLLLALHASGMHARDVFRSDLGLVAVTAALASLGMGVGTLIPHRPGGGLRSDGLQLLTLLRASRAPGGAWEPDPPTLHAIIQVQLLQTRPRDWEPALIEQIARLPVVDRETLAYFRALDRGDASAARDHLQRALDAIATATTRTGRVQRRSLAFEAACFEAAWRCDADASRTWSDRGGSPRMVDEHGAHLAEAARAVVAGDYAAAAAELDRATWAMRRTTLLRLDLLRAPTIDRVRERIAARAQAV